MKIIELFKDSNRDEKIHLTDTNSTVHILGDFSLLIRQKRSVGKYSDEEMNDEEGDESNEDEASIEKRQRYGYGRGRYGYGRGGYGRGRYGYGRGGYGRGRYGYGRGRYGYGK